MKKRKNEITQQALAAQKRGRAPKGSGDRLPPVRVTTEQRELIEAAAKRERQALADWMRAAIDARLMKSRKDAARRRKERQAKRSAPEQLAEALAGP